MDDGTMGHLVATSTRGRGFNSGLLPTLLGDKETLTLLPVERTNFNGHSMETTGKDLMQRKLALRHLYSGERSLPQVKARRCNNQH